MSLQIQNLSKSFGGKPVLQKVSLCVNGPLLLTGPSGCGKTTLLRILMGLETPDSGSFTAPAPLAVVFQEDRLCPQLPAAANITLPGGSPAAATAALCALGFTQQELTLPVARLSGGQRRRVALLRALLCPGAQTLLLDEPFTGMDTPLAEQAAAATARLAAGRDTILVTHTIPAALSAWPVYRLG